MRPPADGLSAAASERARVSPLRGVHQSCSPGLTPARKRPAVPLRVTQSAAASATCELDADGLAGFAGCRPHPQGRQSQGRIARVWTATIR